MNKKMYRAFIEIPKGDDRRRHMKYDKSGLIDLGPIKDVIPVNNGIMPIHYGYVLDTINKKEDPPEELDVLIFSKKQFQISDVIKIKPIAIIKREDNDHKIVATEENDLRGWKEIHDNEKELIKSYFGYKSKIVSIEGEKEAIDLIENSLVVS